MEWTTTVRSKNKRVRSNSNEKTHKVVAIGVHQTISEDDIKTELAKNYVKINKVQRLSLMVNQLEK